MRKVVATNGPRTELAHLDALTLRCARDLSAHPLPLVGQSPYCGLRPLGAPSLHRMARHAVGTACTQHVSRGEDFRCASGLERHPQPGRMIFDRPHVGTVFDHKAEALQMLAQDCLGAPLRKAALKLILAAYILEVRRPDLPQTRTQDLNVPDAHARAKERFDQPIGGSEKRMITRTAVQANTCATENIFLRENKAQSLLSVS
jgi:hypothetical protein